MSGVKHTPGPWECYPARNYSGFAIAPRGTLPTLAAVERPRGNANTLNVTAFNFPGETEANARLIAAAPELLEALMTAKEAIRALHGPNQWDIYDRCSPEMKVINAAIARARGES